MTTQDQNYFEHIREGISLTISDAEELAIMRLRDFAGDELFPALERAVYYGVDQVEARAMEAMKGLEKEHALLDLVMPSVRQVLRDKVSGPFAGLARRPIESVIEEGVRALARASVSARNRVFGHSWKDLVLSGVHWLEARIETLIGIDLDKDGTVGTVDETPPRA